MLCDTLCFIANKYGKVTDKTLKSVLSDFYTAERLSEAKLRLISDIDKLNLPDKRPHISIRREGDGRLAKEVGDIMALFHFIDEHQISDKLPRYVASSPDTMPSIRLYDGDMNVLVSMIRTMNDKLMEFGSALAAISGEVRGLQQVSKELGLRPVPGQPTPAAAVASDINKVSGVTVTSKNGNSASESTTETNYAAAIPDWAVVASTPYPHGSRYAVLSTDDEERYDSSQPPFELVSHSRRKRTRQNTTPRQHPPQSEQQKSSRLVGKAAPVSNAKIKAAKRIRKKAVFCVDNVSTVCSVDDIRSFVSSLSIEVLSCFEVRPRQRRNGRAESNAYDRKAFRLCIFDDDRARLLDAVSWPDSIKVSEWYFKTPNSENDKRPRVSTDVIYDRAAGQPQIVHEINGNTTTAGASSTDTVAAAGAVASDGDVSASAMMSGDETIIQAADHSHYGDDN